MRIVEPKHAISMIEGELTLKSGQEVLISQPINHEPNVSFEDNTYYFFKVDPYDDSDPTHRQLRYDENIEAQFTVTRVKYADGTVKDF